MNIIDWTIAPEENCPSPNSNPNPKPTLTLIWGQFSPWTTVLHHLTYGTYHDVA